MSALLHGNSDALAAPAQSRFLICSALLAEAAAGPQDLAPSLLNLLPYRSPLRRAMALTAGGGIDDSHTELSSALDDRPWELFDHMFPPPPAAPHNEQFLSARPSRDTASIPTALFNPKIKRETMPNVQLHATDIDEGEIDDERTWEDYASERNLGSGFTGEPIAAKQLATMLFAGPEEATIENDITLITSRSPLPALEAAAMSPAATSVSGISQLARPRRKSTRLSQASGSNRDPIPIDEDEEGEISDDVEAIDGPATKRPRTASKSRPTTGGKAPARKTLGGKGVARKVTGGKSVKKTTGGKAPRTGRRRSIVE